MSAIVPSGFGVILPAPSGRLGSVGGVTAGAFRLSTDPLFYADLVLRNVIAGSRYRVTRADTGAELASGVVAGSGLVNETISGVACYANPQAVNVIVRQGTSAPKYLPYSGQTEIAKSGGVMFVAQQLDPIA